MITVTYDSAARQAQVFVDGVLDNTASFGGLQLNLDSFTLGGWGDARRFAGRIADVRIYDRVLSQEEVGSLLEFKDITNGLIAAWDFKGQAGDVVKDSSGKEHDLKKAR
jgi:hypothetical protein